MKRLPTELVPASVRSETLKQAPTEQAVTQTGGDIEKVVVPDTGNADGVTVDRDQCRRW